MINKLVTVIIPTYNRGYIIGNALESLRNQIYKNFEVIVVDDGSNDNTESVVKKFTDLDVRYIKNECNRGANYARNCGIRCAKGEYLAFLDSDNEWKESNLEVKTKLLQDAANNVGFIFGSFYRVKENEVDVYPGADLNLQDSLRERMLNGNLVDTNTVLVKKECFEKVGGFDEGLRRLQDWDMFGRILFEGNYDALFCEEPLVVNKLQKDSITSKPELYLEAKTKILKKRMDDYKKFYEVGRIIESYLRDSQEYEGISIYDRLEYLFTFDIDKTEWDRIWNIKQDYIKQLRQSDRILSVLKKWILLEERGINIVDSLSDEKEYAVYGYGYLGKHLVHELTNAGRKIAYIVDRNPNVTHNTITVYHSPETLPEVDVIIVTSVVEYSQIKDELEKIVAARVISIEDVISTVR